MVGNYVLSIKRSGQVTQYLYPLGCEMRCLADAMAALTIGYSVLIEPPDGAERGGDVHVRG